MVLHQLATCPQKKHWHSFYGVWGHVKQLIMLLIDLNISRSTISKKFYEVLDCVDRMAGDYIRPKDRNFTEVHPNMQTTRFWPHFKDAIGAIDGTHIKMTVPKKPRDTTHEQTRLYKLKCDGNL